MGSLWPRAWGFGSLGMKLQISDVFCRSCASSFMCHAALRTALNKKKAAAAVQPGIVTEAYSPSCLLHLQLLWSNWMHVSRRLGPVELCMEFEFDRVTLCGPVLQGEVPMVHMSIHTLHSVDV